MNANQIKVENTTAKSGGVGFLGLLTIVFITLKLTGYIDWSWWWVFAPVWAPLAFVAFVIVCLVFILRGR